MKIGFYGAAHEVTGSCTLITVAGRKGIVDFGMEQGKDLFENEPLPIAYAELDFVLLTHAHIDHSGMLPLLYKEGYRGPVYASAATCSLSSNLTRPKPCTMVVILPLGSVSVFSILPMTP